MKPRAEGAAKRQDPFPARARHGGSSVPGTTAGRGGEGRGVKEL